MDSFIVFPQFLKQILEKILLRIIIKIMRDSQGGKSRKKTPVCTHDYKGISFWTKYHYFQEWILEKILLHITKNIIMEQQEENCRNKIAASIIDCEKTAN